MNKKDIQVLVNEFKNFKEILLELLFPNTCVLCGKLNKEDICDKCEGLYPVPDTPRCMHCGKFIIDEDAELCEQCRGKQFYFDQGASLWLHSKHITRSVYRFKYANHRVYGKTFAKKMIKHNRNKIISWKPECILPVPIHKTRLKSRGYNQAEVLALEVASEIQTQIGVTLPCIPNLLLRTQKTRFLKLLDSGQRSSSLRGVFEINPKYNVPKTVLVIDDIYTSGATLNEIAKTLKKSGVMEVYFLTISIGQGF